MLTPDGPKVVEYNARFGDPECQAVLSLLETDLMDILEACVDGTLDQLDVKFKDAASCCLVLASGGYPVAYEKGKEITGLDQVKDAVVFHAGTKKQVEVPDQRRPGIGRHRCGPHPSGSRGEGLRRRRPGEL